MSLASHQPMAIAALKHEIGRANIGDMLRLVDDSQCRIDRAEQFGQGGAKTVLGRLATGMERADFADIALNIHLRARPPTFQLKGLMPAVFAAKVFVKCKVTLLARSCSGDASRARAEKTGFALKRGIGHAFPVEHLRE